MPRITKAVITCGGYAARVLPITKAVPKEMLPIGDRPVIHYILAELESAGITDVLILVGRGRECLLNYLDKNYEIDDHLNKIGGRMQTNFFRGLNIYYRRVPIPRGAADCVTYAESFIGGDAFVLAYSDDVFFPPQNGGRIGASAGRDAANGFYGAAELIKEYEKTGLPAVLCSRVPIQDACRYGVVTDGKIAEKPKNPKSNIVAVGRYLLTPKVFELLADKSGGKHNGSGAGEDTRNSENVNIDKNEDSTTGRDRTAGRDNRGKSISGKGVMAAEKEICMTDILNAMGEMRFVETCALRFDTGSKEGLFDAFKYVMKNIAFYAD